MSIVYFLGAGASKAEVPEAALTGDLLAKALKWAAYSLNGHESPVARRLQALVGSVQDLLTLFGTEPPTVDDLLTIVDTAIARGLALSATYSPTTLTLLRPQIVELIHRYVAAEVANGLRTGPLLKLVKRAIAEKATFITLNWDTLLERCICAYRGTDNARFDPHYCLDAFELHTGEPLKLTRPSVVVLKPHGSLNWYSCPLCRRIYVEECRFEATCFYCPAGIATQPVIVPPTALQPLQADILSTLWHRVESSIAECDHVYFIGYSMPPQDTDVRVSLLSALSRRQKSSKPEFTVVDLADTAAIRYKTLFGARATIHCCSRGLEGWLSG